MSARGDSGTFEGQGAVKKAVFLDRDGTLMREVEYCRDPALVECVPGAVAALRALKAAGFLRIIVTNQSGIGRGWISLPEYEAVQEELLRQLEGEIDAVYFCADTPETATGRRKPGAGMLLEAKERFSLDLSRCWMIGDKSDDLLCGRAAGCATGLVLTGYGTSANPALADVVGESLVEVVEKIL